MKMLTVSLLVCAMMALTAAADVPETESNETVVVTNQDEENQSVRTSSCLSGWTNYNSRCFIYVSMPYTWADAERNCQRQGGNLASIHSFEEHFEIQTMILRVTHGFPYTWLGGYDATQEGTWFWSDGTPFNFNYWARGEPNNDNKAHCLAMNYGDEKRFDDQTCRYKGPSVCAKKM